MQIFENFFKITLKKHETEQNIFLDFLYSMYNLKWKKRANSHSLTWSGMTTSK